MFAPFEGIPKATIFGSARTAADDPLYAQARDLARRLATDRWMVITGAGPGIMAAGAEGAGPERSIGVSIRLPFEEKPSEVLVDHDQVVAMKYFFTRKLMLIKRSEEHTSELQSLMRISYAVFCLQKKKHTVQNTNPYHLLRYK